MINTIHLKAVITILFLSICLSSISQTFSSVIAKSGLVIRDQPTLEAKRIGTLAFGETVTLLEQTHKRLGIIDNNQPVSGFWAKIESKTGKIGYVFDGYLLSKKLSPKKEYFKCDPNEPCDSHFSFNACEVTIFRYQTQDNISTKNDTIQAFEFVFNETSDKLLHVSPNSDIDSINVFYTVNETITEQYNTQGENWEEWSKNRVEWEGREGFVKISGKRDYFRIPILEYQKQEIFRKQKMSLRDTAVDLSGESWNIATLVYQEKPCLYIINRVLLKIVLYHKNRTQEEKFIDIDLSYGC